MDPSTTNSTDKVPHGHTCWTHYLIRFWPRQRQIPHSGAPFDLFQKSDDWCLEFLRFNKAQICEMSYLLDIPESFPDGLPLLQQLLYRSSVIDIAMI